MLLRRLTVFGFLSLMFVAISGYAQNDSFADLIAHNPNYSTFNSLAVNELNSLDGAEGDYRVFVPTNAAFESLSPRVLAYLNQNPDLMNRVIRYHISQNQNGSFLSLDSESLAFEETMVDGIAIAGSIPARNGSIYEIHSLLLPEIALPSLDYSSLTGSLRLDGSMTVAPLTNAIVSPFAETAPNVLIANNSRGTVEGFQALCFRLEADVVGASRAIHLDETELCRANNLQPLGFQIGVDALAVMVNAGNNFVESLSLEQLAFVFSDPRDATGAVIRPRRWVDINPAWPDEPIERYFPSQAHGTFDYFVTTVFQPIYDGIAAGSLNLADYDFYSPVDFSSEGLFAADGTLILENGANLQESMRTIQELGDTTLLAELSRQELERTTRPLILSQERVQGDEFAQLRRETATRPFAIGFVGYSYLGEEVKALAINGVEASVLNIHDGTYPLARPLYIYSDAGLMQSQPAVSGFIHYYLASLSINGLPEGFFPLNQRDERMARLQWLAAMALGNQ